MTLPAMNANDAIFLPALSSRPAPDVIVINKHTSSHNHSQMSWQLSMSHADRRGIEATGENYANYTCIEVMFCSECTYNAGVFRADNCFSWIHYLCDIFHVYEKHSLFLLITELIQVINIAMLAGGEISHGMHTERMEILQEDEIKL